MQQSAKFIESTEMRKNDLLKSIGNHPLNKQETIVIGSNVIFLTEKLLYWVLVIMDKQEEFRSCQRQNHRLIDGKFYQFVAIGSMHILIFRGMLCVLLHNSRPITQSKQLFLDFFYLIPIWYIIKLQTTITCSKAVVKLGTIADYRGINCDL